jgi:hypothetical protein
MPVLVVLAVAELITVPVKVLQTARQVMLDLILLLKVLPVEALQAAEPVAVAELVQ